MSIEILVAIHASDSPATCALIFLEDKEIRNIIRMSKRADKHGHASTFDYSPALGNTEVDLSDVPYRNVTDLSSMMGDNEIFTEDPSIRKDAVELHVSQTEFWWSGYFKHTDIQWETNLIPLSLLPQRAARQSGRKEYSPLPQEKSNEIIEKIARGCAHGLNAREITQSFQRHVTLEQLVQCVIDSLQKGS
jgi:hypothetical protein